MSAASDRGGVGTHRRAFDYVTVGHVTIDVLPHSPHPGGGTRPPDPGAWQPDDGAPQSSAGVRQPGSGAQPTDGVRQPGGGAQPTGGVRQPGGGAFYSALQAARLGLRTLIVTRGAPDELEPLLAPYARELTVQIVPAEHTTTLLTLWRDGHRTQRVLAWAGPFREPIGVDTEILHLAPVARETPRTWSGKADFVGLTPQGLVRAWGADGEIVSADLDRDRVPARCDAIVFSAEEHGHCEELRSTRDPVIAITAGARPTMVRHGGAPPIAVPACDTTPAHDDLGAGDVFAAAFFIALHEGRPAVEAAAFGHAAAATRIAGVGAGAIGDRRAIEQRLSAGAD